MGRPAERFFEAQKDMAFVVLHSAGESFGEHFGAAESMVCNWRRGRHGGDEQGADTGEEADRETQAGQDHERKKA